MRGALHAIYWRLHSAYLRNDRHKADLMLSMLCDDIKKDPDSLRKEIGHIHYLRFIQIKSNIEKGYYGRIYGQGAQAPILQEFPKLEKSSSEKEFCKLLISREGREKLATACGLNPQCNLFEENDMEEFGRVDFILKQGRKWGAIEVKVGKAPTSVVSQIDRYRLGLELDMCLGMHDEVFGVVLAESFPQYVACELSRLSVIMLSHSGTLDSLRRLT